LASDLASPLRGRGILVTRPVEQAAGLARLIEQAGGRAHLFPAIEIQDLPPPRALARLQEFDLAVFVSPTAAARVMRHVQAWPGKLRAAAVGAGTRRELERHGVTNVISPSRGADSEALLALPELGAFKAIVIFRGEGGRELLGETLAALGARVEHAACYRRARPRAQPQPWKAGEISAVTVSSAQGLANLFEMLDPGLLRAAPLFVPHARIAEQARARAVREVVVAGASDEEMLERLVAYFRSHD